MKILIVEDSKFTRALLKRELATAHDVLEASDGAEGLRFLAELGPDLILVDLLMPQMDGFEFLQRVRGLGSEVPVVVCSANTQPSVEARIRELGGTAFVAKPELLVRGRALALVAELQSTMFRNPGLSDLMEKGLLEKALEAAEDLLTRITGLPATARSASLEHGAVAKTELDGFDVVMELSGQMEGTSSVRILGEDILMAAVRNLGPMPELQQPGDLAGELGNLLINAFVARFAEAARDEIFVSGPVTTASSRMEPSSEADIVRLRAQFEVHGISEPVSLSLSLSPNVFKELIARLRRKDGINA